MVAYGAGQGVVVYSMKSGAVVGTFAAPARVCKVRWLHWDEQEGKDKVCKWSVLAASCDAGLVVILFGDELWGSLPDVCGKAVVTLVPVQSDQQVAADTPMRFHGLCVLPDGYGRDVAMIAMSGSHLAAFECRVDSTSRRVLVAQVGPVLALNGRRVSECVAAAILPLSQPSIVVLALGGADNRVHLYVADANCTREAGRLGYVTWLEGHEDWVRDLDWHVDESGDLLLASCSHDNYVRLWRVQRYTDGRLMGESLVQESERRQRITFAVNDAEGNVPRFTVGFDALLIGHRHWVQSVRWHHATHTLLSSSMDKIMIVWNRDPDEGVWLDKLRVGEIGGNALGFYGAMFSPAGDMILAHSFNGSFHLWKRHGNQFVAAPTISGHLGEVNDVAWDHKGRYVVSVASDETVRVWAPCSSSHWAELARPQIHGHPLNAALLLPLHEHVLITGSEEKAIRVFSATQSFVKSLQNVSGALTESFETVRPFGAILPPLGLSNKPLMTAHDAVAAEQARQEEAFAEELPRAAPVILTEAPIETQLAQSTLWPEDKKLYGHGSEMFALASSHNGKLVASACKGKAKPHTDVFLWRVSDWTMVCRLSQHKMTVTRVCFSHNDTYIATVSRDLRLCIWKRRADDSSDVYELLCDAEKAHTRIIWDLAWSPDDTSLVTCSRDKKAICWNLTVAGDGSASLEIGATLKRSAPLTACTCFPRPLSNGNFVVAIGSEEGAVSLWTCEGNRTKWRQLIELRLHGQMVKRLCMQHVPHTGSMMLAAAGADSSVRLLRVVVTSRFEQLCGLVLCAHASFGTWLPHLVLEVVWKHLRAADGVFKK